jgi:hypothetical protein
MKIYNKMYKKIKTFFSKLNNINLLFMGLCWILLFLYLRLLMIRPAYDLATLKLTYLYFFLSLIFILIHLTFIILSVKTILKRKNQLFLIKLTNLIQKTLDKVFWQPIMYVRDFIAPDLPYSGIMFCKFSAFLDKKSFLFLKILVILFCFTPRLLVACIFFIEILFFSRIQVFLFALILLIIPVIWNVFVNLFSNFAERNIPVLKNLIIIKPVGDMLPNGFSTEYKFYLQPKYPTLNLLEYSKMWYILVKIYGYSEIHFIAFKNKINPYITTVCSSLYLFAGIYRICFLLTC